MTDATMRSIFQNDTVIGRHLDGDSDSDDDSSLSDDDTLTTPVAVGGGGGGASSTALPGGGGSARNTGPKGVRSDARAFQASMTAQKQSRQAALSAMAYDDERGAGLTFGEEEAERDAHERWVEARLKELSKSSSSSGGVNSTLFENVDASDYLAIVDATPLVCVLIHNPDDDDDDKDDEEFTNLLKVVFRRYKGVRSIKLHFKEAEMDDIACPALLLYQDGELIKTCLRVDEEIPSEQDVTHRNVETVLLQLGILQDKYRIDQS